MAPLYFKQGRVCLKNLEPVKQMLGLLTHLLKAAQVVEAQIGVDPRDEEDKGRYLTHPHTCSYPPPKSFTMGARLLLFYFYLASI